MTVIKFHYVVGKWYCFGLNFTITNISFLRQIRPKSVPYL